MIDILVFEVHYMNREVAKWLLIRTMSRTWIRHFYAKRKKQPIQVNTYL